jgi:hypothetical protein
MFFLEFLPQRKLVFFLSFLLACLPCVLSMATSQSPTPYFHHYRYSYHRCLLPPTSTIAICSHLPTTTYFHHHRLLSPTCSRLLLPSLLTSAIIACSSISLASPYFVAYFRHRHLFLHASIYFITCFCHHHLLSHASTIIAYSHLLPPLPLAYSRLRRLLPPTSIIVTSLSSSHVSTYFAACLPILVVDMFQFRDCLFSLVFSHLFICVGGGT